MAALILQVGMPVNAEPAINPTQDPKVQAPVKVVSHEVKNKTFKKEHKKMEKTVKEIGSTTTPESKNSEASPTGEGNKKTN